MNLTDVLLVVLLIVTGGILYQVTRSHDGRVPGAPGEKTPAAELSTSTALAPVQTSGFMVRVAARDESKTELYVEQLDTPLLALHSADVRGRTVERADAFVQDTLVAMMRQSPELLQRLRSQPVPTSGYVVTFPKEAQRALAKGTARLMQSGSRTLPTVVSASSGKIFAHGTIVTGTASAAGGATGAGAGGAVAVGGVVAAPLLPVVAVGVVAVGAVYLMSRKLQSAVEKVEKRVLQILDRMQDDDYGRLEAALHVARGVEALVRGGQDVPEHDRLRLAIACRDADAIYLSRHRLLERFQTDYERIYDEHQQRGGQLDKLPKEFQKLLTDPERFGKEAAIYTAALVARARTEVTVAGLLAVEGQGDLALQRLQSIAAELDTDAHDFKRRMHKLSEAGARGSKREAIVGMAKKVTSMLDLAVDELPPRELVDVTVRVQLPAGMLEEAAT